MAEENKSTPAHKHRGGWARGGEGMQWMEADGCAGYKKKKKKKKNV